MEEDDEETAEIKLEFEEEGDDIDSAQALMTLHDSVINMPMKHKSALQVAVQDASPAKKFRPRDHYDKSSEQDPLPNRENFITIKSRKQCYPSHISESLLQSEPMFSTGRQQTMKILLANVNNILKQSAARRWVYYEWFYSNIDRALLLGENDFQSCIRLLFKGLKLDKLTRIQWSIMRRLMGKPRRCSAAFFEEERRSLEEKRKKIRYLHQLKGFEVKDMTQFKDLPEEIPMPMVIGTKVTAKVHPEGDGLRLFTGTVDAVDNTNNTFRINFEREGIGTHTVSDVEVASEEYEAMNLQLFIVKERPKIAGGNSPTENLTTTITQNNEDDSRNVNYSTHIHDLTGTYGGFPVQFLLYLAKLSKIVELKKKYVEKLKQMNSEVELRKPYHDMITKDFQKTYASVVLELDKINKELTSTFNNIHQFMIEEKPHLGFIDRSIATKQYCDTTATELVEQSERLVESERLKSLVTKLTSLMLQMNCHAEMEKGTVELSSIDETLADIKTSLSKRNLSLFEDQVETNIAFIKTGLQEGGNNMLAAFSYNRRSKKKIETVEYDDDGDDEEEEFEEIDDEQMESGNDV